MIGGVKKFECTVCNQTFGSKKNLMKHIETRHQDQKRFKCHFCEKYYTQPGSLNRHIKTLHERQKKYRRNSWKRLHSIRSSEKAHQDNSRRTKKLQM